MKFRFRHIKSEAFKLEFSSKVYERIRATVIYKDGSVIDNLFFWYDFKAMKAFVLSLANNVGTDFTVYFVEPRHSANPHCKTGNLLMTSRCRFYEE